MILWWARLQGYGFRLPEDSKFATGEKLFVELDNEALKVLEGISQQHESRYGANALDAYARTIVGNDKRLADNALTAYEKAKEHLRHLEHDSEIENSSYQTWRPKNKDYYLTRYPGLEERRFGVTQNGDTGLFPIPTEVGDHVCVFQGCKAPFVLRQKYDEASILIWWCLCSLSMYQLQSTTSNTSRGG